MQRGWQPKPGDQVVRRPRPEEIRPTTLSVPLRAARPHLLNSPLTLLFGLTILIAIGTVLLLFPFANTTGGWTPFMVSFFTATSSATVTGLIVVDTPVYWSATRQPSFSEYVVTSRDQLS